MPKKYLLYIENDKFFDGLKKRGEKSGLINRLIAEYIKKKGLEKKL